MIAAGLMPQIVDGRARVFVSQHAMARFRERILQIVSDEAIVAAVQRGVAAPLSAHHRLLADGTPSVTLRVRDQLVAGQRCSYRVVLLPPRMPGGWPVAGTVLHGSRGQSRGRKHYSELRARGVPPEVRP